MSDEKRYVKKTYARAPAFARIFARIFDLLFIFGIWILIYFLFQINGFNFLHFFIASMINISISLFYFLFSLYMFGCTIFMFLFKIKLFNDQNIKTKLFIKIIKHEFFLTIFYNFFIFILAFFLLIIGQKNSVLFFQFLFTQVFQGPVDQGGIEQVPLEIQIFAYFYSAFSLSLSFIFIMIIALTIYKSKKQTWIDLISGTNTLWIGNQKIPVSKKTKTKTIIDMPGVFDSDEIIFDKGDKNE